jgi:drug/metabolite transporter (DMT)-like permease
MLSSPHARGILYGALSGCALSLGGLIVRLLSAEVTVWQFLTWRSLAFAGLMFTIAFLRAGSPRGLRQGVIELGWRGLPIALAVAVGQTCYVLALTHTTVANTTFILGSAPLFTAFAAWLLLGERLSLRGFLALTAALIGVGIMVTGGLAGGRWLGNLFAGGALATYGAYVLLLRHARNIDSFAASGLGGLLGAVIAFILGGGELVMPWKDLMLALACGTFQVGAGFAFATLAARLIPAAEVTLLILLEAIIGPLLVWFFVAEVPAVATLAGGAIVLASVVAYASFSLQEERRRQNARKSLAGSVEG